jgi:hypothetical protein
MAEAITKVEETLDVQRVLTTVTTTQSTESEPQQDPDAKSYRLEYVDSVYTLVSEKVSKDDQTPQNQVDGSVSSDPLETHYLFKDVPSTVKSNWLKWKAGQVTNPVDWSPAKEADSKFAKFYKKYKNGFETYYAARIVLRMTELEDGPPSPKYLGQIETPKFDTHSNPSGVTFILSAVRGVQEGGLWRNTYEWLGSAANGQGWDSLIYGN